MSQTQLHKSLPNSKTKHKKVIQVFTSLVSSSRFSSLTMSAQAEVREIVKTGSDFFVPSKKINIGLTNYILTALACFSTIVALYIPSQNLVGKQIQCIGEHASVHESVCQSQLYYKPYGAYKEHIQHFAFFRLSTIYFTVFGK